jgi:hypothetical protein
MLLTVRMESNGFAGPAKEDVTHHGGAAAAAAMSDPNRHVVVATVEGAVIGWGKTHYWDHDDGPALSGHYLGGVTVLPAWRRRGGWVF